MPFWEMTRKMWRGQVKFQGQSFRADFRIKREAIDWEVKKRKELQVSGQKTTPTDMDLQSFFNKYLDYANLHFVGKTYKNKQRVCKRVLLHIGNLLVSEVSPSLIDDYLASQVPVRSKAGYNEDFKHLRALWAWGCNVLDLPTNPVAKLRRIPQDRTPQYTPPTKDILEVLAAATPDERVFLTSYLQTGARRSEIFRWTWIDDINFEKREVRLTTRKTKDGSEDSQWSPMSDELYKELWWWWKNRPIKDTPFVFVSTSSRHRGKPFTTRRKFLKGLCKRDGIRPFEFHALRRYVASVLADTHKVSAKTIQRVLRHKNVMTTERYIQNINQDLASTINLLSGKGPHEGSPKEIEK